MKAKRGGVDMWKMCALASVGIIACTSADRSPSPVGSGVQGETVECQIPEAATTLDAGWGCQPSLNVSYVCQGDVPTFLADGGILLALPDGAVTQGLATCQSSVGCSESEYRLTCIAPVVDDSGFPTNAQAPSPAYAGACRISNSVEPWQVSYCCPCGG
jgi:hypothetical protein